MREFLSVNNVAYEDRNIRKLPEARTELEARTGDLVVPQQTRHEVAVLKGIAARYVMFTDARVPMYAQQQIVIAELVEAVGRTAPDSLEPAFRVDWAAATDDHQLRRVIVDQIASLTDVSAYAWHRRLVTGGFRRAR